MSKSLYFKSVAVVMILSVISFAAAPANETAQPQQEKPSTDSVLVEACLVQVSNASLAPADAIPNGDKESISITKLLWCMKDPNSGKVVSMARAFGLAKITAKSSTLATVYIGNTTTQVPTTGHAIQSVTYQAYDCKSEIEVRPFINEDGSMLLELEFMYSGFVEKPNESGQAPPNKLTYRFSSTPAIKPNKPMIVGGMQSGDSSLFLVIRAQIVK